MAEEILCACCEKSVPEDAEFCPHCRCRCKCESGHRLGQGSPTHLYCRYCNDYLVKAHQ